MKKDMESSRGGGVGRNGRIQILNSLQGGNSGSNGGSSQINGAGQMGEKDKPLDILQVDGTLSEKNVGPRDLIGGSSPCEVVLENGKEIRRWSSLFGTRPSKKYSLPLV